MGEQTFLAWRRRIVPQGNGRRTTGWRRTTTVCPCTARIRGRLGNHREGYFVIYREEQVPPARRKGIYFYRYEYDVLYGLDNAVTYVKALPGDWTWELIQHFPDTRSGRDKAYALREKLIKKKRTGKAS